MGLRRLLDWYAGRDLVWPDPGTEHRARLAFRFAVGAGAIELLFAAVYLTLPFRSGAAFLAGEGLLVLATPLALRRWRRPELAGHLLGAVVLSTICFIAQARDDLGVPPLMFGATLPLIAMTLSGRRAALIWTALPAVACGFFYVRVATGRARWADEIGHVTLEQKLSTDALGLIALLALVLVVALTIQATLRAETEARERMVLELGQKRRLETIGLLAAGAAHEINNPLAVAFSAAQLFERELSRLPASPEATALSPALRDELLGAARDAVVGCERVREIVRGLNHFSRSNTPDESEVSLPAVVERAILLARGELRKGPTRLVCELEPVPTIRGNPGRLCEVVLNLLVNAAQAAEGEAGEIRVRTWADDDAVHLEVADSGRGIAPEHLDRIFEPFFTTKRVGEGTGLGLYLCWEIVRAHGGHIEAHSRPGHGTRFEVRLPREAAAGRARAMA